MNTGHITNDIGRVIPLHKGEYNAATPYELNDCVSFQGSTYWHYKPEETIGVLPTDEAVWRLMTNATDVEPYVERALQAAEDAEEARDAAQEAETGAESAKTAAQTSASNAELAAGRAESAQDAAEDARDDAESARDDAQTAKTNAEAAKTDAEAAKTAAETAQAGAEAAKTNALASATAAYNSEQSALNAKTAAETAKTAAQSAQTAAETAEDNAETAKTAAEAAKTAAETAQDEAETAQAGAATSAQDAQESAEDAEAYAVGKRAGVDVPSTDPAYHNNAKYYAEQAETTTQAVKYVEQTLTDSQKEQARENINATAPDGFYHGMGVGNAEQLISSVGVTDKAPYNFRTAGGSADIGNRLNDKLVGGTVAWNQLAQNGNFSNGKANWELGGSFTVEDGVAKLSWISEYENNGLRQNFTYSVGHKYLVYAKTKNVGEATRRLYLGQAYGAANKITKLIEAGPVVEMAGVINITQNTGSGYEVFELSTSINTEAKFWVYAVMCFDLTAMFGSTLADYIYSLEQATAGAGVAWFKKLFPKPYYEYNAGELMSVCTNAHITRGFNQIDENFVKGSFDPLTGTFFETSSGIQLISRNKFKVIGGATYSITAPYNISASGFFVAFYDDSNAYIGRTGYTFTFTAPANAVKMRVALSSVYGTTYNHDICINLSWSGYRNGEYEPYVEHRYPLSPVELRGIPKLDASNNLYFDGDTYEKDGKVTRRYGIVDLGTLNWTYIDSYTNPVFAVKFTDAKGNDTGKARVLCDLFESYYGDYTRMPDMKIQIRTSGTYNVFVTNADYTDAASFKAAMSGVYLVYELATPTTETADPFADPQIVDDFGTEEYVDALATAETNPRDVVIPVGHDTFYQANLRDKLQHLPANANADGLYLVKQTRSKQELIAYTPESELPTVSSEGTYALKSVNGVLTWVLES